MGDGPIERCRTEIARLAEEALSPPAGAEALAGLLRAVHALIERALEAARVAEQPAPACAPGCAACCTVNVATLPIEGAVAAAWLAERLPAAERSERAKALLAFHDRVRWLEDEDRISWRETCPHLDAGGRCVIHPVRPLSCRSLSSLDPADCRRALRERMERDGGGDVRMNLLQQVLYTDAVQVLQESLSRRGLDARCRDVSGMAGIFLAEPALVERLLAGERLPIE
ncbi:MAG TPA: YkgJ family cysteine cluster protein [Anaeromyxobacteraceae bacterium]|nr:YkgJ family cysteine cluster protein [Anaeromyxobacteraceae bacterium]